jgi:hypothetical protein
MRAETAARRRERAGSLPARASFRGRLVSLVHLGFGAGRVEQVLDVLHALDAARLLLEVADQLGTFDLAAEDDDAVLGVDVDLALRDVGVAEDLGLDLASERRVVRVLELVGVFTFFARWTRPSASACTLSAARPI